MRPSASWSYVLLIALNLLTFVCDAVRLIRERGLRDNTHFYHNGDSGHAYHFNTETATSIYFKCVQYEKLRCPGRAILRLNGGFRHSNPHNHLPYGDLVGERHFRANVLEEVRNHRYVNFQDIVEQARRDRRYSRNVRMKMNVRRLRTSMAKARAKKFPPVPLTLLELTQVLLAHPEVSVTVDEEQNMYGGSVTADDGGHHIVFASRRMLDFMGECTLLQGDGTFKARPATPHSSQCFAIVTTYDDGIIPIAWVLMENRTYQGYMAVFRLLKHLCPNLNPETIISDWELGQQRAWSESFPNATIQGCLWHLCRAFIAKAQKLGVFRFRRAFPSIMDFIRKACVICLLPEHLFDEGWAVLTERARGIHLVSAYLLRGFFEFVRLKWLGKPYRREYMTFYGCLLRTNNSCESHNRMLKRAVGAHRPNIYAFIEALARLEHTAYLDYLHMRGGGDARSTRRWRSVYNDQTLSNLCRDLERDIFHNRDETIWNFIDHASRLIEGTFEEQVRNLEPRRPGAGQGRRRR